MGQETVLIITLSKKKKKSFSYFCEVKFSTAVICQLHPVFEALYLYKSFADLFYSPLYFKDISTCSCINEVAAMDAKGKRLYLMFPIKINQ